MSSQSRDAMPFVCPKCNGQRRVWTPPHVPGDQPTFVTNTIEAYECPVCHGAGVLWPPTTVTVSVSNEISDPDWTAQDEQIVQEYSRLSLAGTTARLACEILHLRAENDSIMKTYTELAALYDRLHEQHDAKCGEVIALRDDNLTLTERREFAARDLAIIARHCPDEDTRKLAATARALLVGPSDEESPHA